MASLIGEHEFLLFLYDIGHNRFIPFNPIVAAAVNRLQLINKKLGVLYLNLYEKTLTQMQNK
ncbi:MAG: hypothetical protein Sapg2KO_34090 [Saprospiraceae bacterium]